MKGWLMRVFGQRGEQDRERPPITAETVRDEMTRDDPEYARVRQALHDGRNLQTAARKQAILEEIARRAQRIQTIEDAWGRRQDDVQH